MHVREPNRPVSLVALLLTAVVTGAFAGAVGGGFIWVVEEGIGFLWSDLPDKFGVGPFDSWWLFAVPIVGGALVGIGQRVLGNYPRPIEEAMATWRAGGHIEPIVAPKTFVNSVLSLTFGGPVGFEAALTGLLGGTATWINSRIAGVGRFVRQAWGAERIDSLPKTMHHLPYWLAAVSGLVAYHSLPFGRIDLSFRFTDFDGHIDLVDAIAMFTFGALVVVPAAWALVVVGRAEQATFFSRSPILIGMAGGAVFALLALPNSLVLFSGQQGIQLLPETGNGDLIYIVVAKWLALVVALYAGWRGGPIFPTYTAVAALGVLADEVVDIGPDLLMISGIAAVGVVFLKGSLPMAFVLTLYPVHLSYASVILVGCLGGAVGLAIARSAGILPLTEADSAASQVESAGSSGDG
ncbi:hypothetical protein [Ilumatobacter sp.]|uniref:hypothetical protein n=1 Tax=Ilumatobacter sp. TaxID=1967498 RepID=UPI003C55A644